MKYVHLRTGGLVSILLAALASCAASVPPPHDQIAASEASLRAAQEVGARDLPEAALFVQLAQDGLERGKRYMRQGDNRDARWMLLRAQADAELALAMARESKTRAAAEQAKARVAALRMGVAPGTAIGGGPADPSRSTSQPGTAVPPSSGSQPGGNPSPTPPMSNPLNPPSANPPLPNPPIRNQ
ncbi:MAG TPA: DUF4398 domain-containing protein [Polyangiaceae bacterium]